MPMDHPKQPLLACFLLLHFSQESPKRKLNRLLWLLLKETPPSLRTRGSSASSSRSLDDEDMLMSQ
jgi:hypothetical protein